MKLINYKYGYINAFSCSIHGKIIVSMKEWQKICKYLGRAYIGGKNYNVIYKPIFAKDIKNTITSKKGLLCNIRVPATELVIKKFNLKGYKRGNYMFLILT